MNISTVLLGLTSLLLVVGLAFTFGGFSNGGGGASYKSEIEELREELKQLEAIERVRTLGQVRTTPQPIAPASIEPSLEMQRSLQEKEAEIANLQREKAELAEAKSAIEAENEDILAEKNERRTEQSMAAFRVKNALTMGTVTTAQKDNALVIFTPSASANFQPGRVLAVRRNSGIIGQIEVQSLADSGEYIATMRPHGYSPDGYPDIATGDTVIINIEN